MKRKMLFIAALFFCATVAYSQQSTPATGQYIPKPKKIQRIGLQAGMNLPQMIFTRINDPEFYPELQAFPRLNAGFYSEMGVSENFVTQFGLFYSGAGYQGEGYKTSIDYLKIPLVFNFRTEITGPVALMVGAGAYGAFAFNGSMVDDELIDRNILSFPSNTVADNRPYSYLDAGVMFSGAIEYKLPNDNLIKIGVSYDFGILNVSNEYRLDLGPGANVIIDEGARNRIFSLHLTYMLDLLQKKEGEAP